MQLILNPTSPFARLARIALAECGVQPALAFVDPWDDPAPLRAANAAARVPALLLDDGTALTESLLIVMWLQQARPGGAGLLGDADTAAGVLARAGIAFGGIEAAVHTLVGRKVVASTGFDEQPVGLRRRRTMVECLQRLEAEAQHLRVPPAGQGAVLLDTIAAVVLHDYVAFRFDGAAWRPAVPRLAALAALAASRPSFADSAPR